MKRITMRQPAAVLALAAAALFQVQAQAADEGVSRAQVQAELAAAQRAGQLAPAGELLAPVPAGGVALSRAEVRTETLRALRNHTLVAAGEAGTTDAAFVQPAVQYAGKTRAQVKAEFAEARRSGDLLVAGESGLSQREVSPSLYRGAPVRSAPTLADAGVRKTTP